jgi:hypothetical protein
MKIGDDEEAVAGRCHSFLASDSGLEERHETLRLKSVLLGIGRMSIRESLCVRMLPAV